MMGKAGMLRILPGKEARFNVASCGRVQDRATHSHSSSQSLKQEHDGHSFHRSATKARRWINNARDALLQAAMRVSSAQGMQSSLLSDELLGKPAFALDMRASLWMAAGSIELLAGVGM